MPVPAFVPIGALIVGFTALLVTTSGLGMAVANFFGGGVIKAKLDEIRNQLDALALGQKDINEELQSLQSEVEWSQIVTLIGKPVQKIQYLFEQMKLLIPPANLSEAETASWRTAKEKDAKKWAKAVVDVKGGIPQQLSFINSAFGGVSLAKPLMLTLIEKARNNKRKTQSEYFFVSTVFRSIVLSEASGLFMLVAAHKILNPAATEKQVEDFMEPYKTQYVNQINANVPLLTDLNRFWTALPTGAASPPPIEWTNWTMVAVDSDLVLADMGNVVVGLELYRRDAPVENPEGPPLVTIPESVIYVFGRPVKLGGNTVRAPAAQHVRLALRIVQAKLDSVGEIVVSSKQESVRSPSNYFQFGQNTNVTLMTTVAPANTVVTGACLAPGEGNKLMVLLAYVPFDFATRKADFTQPPVLTTPAAAIPTPGGQWFTSDPDGRVAANSSRGRAGVGYKVAPHPPCPITGVRLDVMPGTGVGYMGLRVKTDFYGPDEPSSTKALAAGA